MKEEFLMIDAYYRAALLQTKRAGGVLSGVATEKKNQLLHTLATSLIREMEEILHANKEDRQKAINAGCDEAFINRLTVTSESLIALAKSVTEIAQFPDPVGHIREERTVERGIRLQKITVPLGVLAVIYESRPNVTIDAAALALKAGSAIVLKGGSEAIRTNRVLVDLVQEALRDSSLPQSAVLFLDTSNREIVSWLLHQDQVIDVVIPRGGYGLVRAVVEQSRIPVLYHAAGGARIYVDASADLEMAVAVCVNAKISRPATCNSLDTILVHETIAEKFVPLVVSELQKKEVSVIGDNQTCSIVGAILPAQAGHESPLQLLQQAKDEDWATEFLSLHASIKVVKDIQEAILHIHRYTKKHTEGIIASKQSIIDQFVTAVDAAAIMVNCSTRLHDGGIFGLGAEMGIATGKLHARGPVGLNELTTYKWIAVGNGQIR